MLVFVGHREKMILCVAGNIGDCIAAHDVGVHIDRIDRVGDQDDIAASEQVCDISRIALGAVGDKDGVRVHIHAVFLIISRDGVPGRFVSLLRAVAFERIGCGHGVHAFMQRV